MPRRRKRRLRAVEDAGDDVLLDLGDVIAPRDYTRDHRSGGIDPRSKLPATVDPSRFGKQVTVTMVVGKFNRSPAFDLSFYRDLDDVMESARDWTVYAQPNLLLSQTFDGDSSVDNNTWAAIHFLFWVNPRPLPPIVLDVEHGPGAAAVTTTHRVSVVGSAMHIVDPMALGQLRAVNSLDPDRPTPVPFITNVVVAPGQPTWTKDVHTLGGIQPSTATTTFPIPPFTRTVRAFQNETTFTAVGMPVILDFEDKFGNVLGSYEVQGQSWLLSFDSFPVPPTAYLYRVRNLDPNDTVEVIVEWGVYC